VRLGGQSWFEIPTHRVRLCLESYFSSSRAVYSSRDFTFGTDIAVPTDLTDPGEC